MDALIDFQIEQLQKLSFKFYVLLANGKEPLTYSISDKNGQETQVEVNAKLLNNADGVLLSIDFDSHWEGRWKPTSKVKSYYLSSNAEWSESSFDGSEFAE